MNHEQWDARLAAYRDASPSEREAIDRHIAGCPACADQLREYETMDSALSGLRDPRPESELRQRLVAAATRSQSRGWRPWLRSLPGRVMEAAAVLLLVAGFWALYQGWIRPPNMPAPAVQATATAERGLEGTAPSEAPGETPLPARSVETPSAGTVRLGKVAYVQDGDIWVKSLPDGEPQQRTESGSASNPRWSPSGRWLAYRDDVSLGVSVLDREGGEARVVSRGPVDDFAWSPTEDRLGLLVGSGMTTLHIWDAASGGMATLSNLEMGDPIVNIGRFAWSPDGAQIAYDIMGPQGSSLWIAPLEGTQGAELKQVYDGSDPEIGGAILAGWTGDGRYLFFWQDLMSASLQADGVPLYAVSVEGGAPEMLVPAMLTYPDFIAAYPGDAPSVSAVAIVAGGGRSAWTNKELYGRTPGIGEPNGAAPVHAETAVSSPAWAPGGQSIAFIVMPDAGGEITGGEPALDALMLRRLYVLTDEPHQLTDDPAYRDEWPRWSADGEHILFARLDQEGQASLWIVPARGGEPQQVVDAITPAPDPFGYYGHIDWKPYFDWWTPPVTQSTPARPSAEPTTAVRTPLPTTTPVTAVIATPDPRTPSSEGDEKTRAYYDEEGG